MDKLFIEIYNYNKSCKINKKGKTYEEKKKSRKLEGKETPLPPKFLIEILDNAFQGDDEMIQEEWNSLLVNWQDPEKNCDKKYFYIELLKNLGKNEIILLKIIKNDPNYNDAISNPNYYYDMKLVKQKMNLTQEENELMILNLNLLKILIV